MAPKRVTPRGQAARPPKAEKPAPAAKKTTARKKAEPASEHSYLRNIRYVEARITLEDGRRINFMPRGQRGDLARVANDNLSDPIIQENIGHIVEIIPESAGLDIIRKQQTNQSTSQPPLISQLTNERGEVYEQGAVRVTASNEEQATVVAQVEQTGQGRFSEQNTELVRPMGPTIVDRPGSLPTAQEVDAAARATKGEDAGDLLRSQFKVSVEPTQQG